ncbi:SusC/RagA family TonB-linked outer membrane protein [Flavobacterium sp. ANB]|uniref:SusC/RagA family TonB-linked outer membrane protein n=1 Tax=unclassified Flavobacterium TaxID=196869 RepID=UPI0012B843AC|nr:MULTISPECIES: SusC/RagA family TonB-linked outer membrane protein [unclassified Flavobacterium]MBF4516802.1 SusC/RagA family TonB-linked outer membrane protein [Flavobacterium sp. ANB]MTD69302.1 SusC/RagA family TonB-linked outer membrane protein [Flavobacterium sp. LC2016-13]
MTFSIPNLRKILFFLALLLSCFKGFSQNKLITLNVKNKPISLIIKSIEEQSDFRIIYNARKIDADQLADINVQNATLETALTQLFNGKNISFYIQKKQVLLTNAAPAETSNTQETERFISGIVYNAKDKLPLPGATIRVLGTGMGAITDFNGKFVYQLKGNNIQNIVLEVSFLGMQTQTQKADHKTTFVFNLEEITDELNPVVITSSYGTTKLKEEIVGSISTLNAKDIAVEQASESFDKMITGQIAGVLVENTSGVGGPVKINIRGQGTLPSFTNARTGTSTQPLFIVDGIVMSEESGLDATYFTGNGDSAENFSNPLMKIAPENIESISVLKDAAAVGIYGADGANGVILITTKKGKKGKTQFGFSNQLGISSAINQIKYLNGEQYTELRNEYVKNTSPGSVPTAYNGINTDWFDLLNRTGVYNKYNFNVSGSTSKFSYRTNISYTKIDEPQMGNNLKQLNAGINLGYSHKKLDINLMLNPSFIQKDAPNIFYSFAYLPTLSPYNADGSYSYLGASGVTRGNPLAAIEQNKNETNTYGILGSLNIGYQINKALRFSTLFGLDYTDKEQDRYFSGENESGQFLSTFTLGGNTYSRWGRRLINQRNSTKWNWQGQLLFDKQLNENHAIDGVIGFELAQDKTDFNYKSAVGFVNPNRINAISDAIIDDNPNTPLDESKNNQTFGDDINYNSRVSAFSQVNYNYKKRYYFLANFRRDESSVFGDDTNVANNGGAGVSWILSNEKFLKSNSWIDFLKLKASYGTTGNSRIGSYRSKGLYTIHQNGYNGLDGAVTDLPPNGNLSWEKNTKFNTGIDFNIFNRLDFSVEYYYNDLSDLITTRDIPTETGYSSLQLNAASMYNKGFEFSARIKWVKTDSFKWTSSFNISTVENKVTDLKGLGSDYSQAEVALAQKVGYSTTTIWGIKWVGVDPATGRDLVEKNGKIYDAMTYKSLYTIADWEPIGDSQPDAFGGFYNSFTFYNNLVLAVRGDFQIGGDFLAQDVLIDKYSNTSNRNLSVNADDHWRNPGDIVTQSAVANSPIMANLSKYVYDATYIRLSNINLSYNIPLKNTFLDALSVFADATNVAYWYKEKSPKGMNGIREFNYTYPQARTISLGMNAKF